MAGRRLVGTVAVVAFLAAALGAGGVAWAAHQFSDVGDDHPFHDEIAQLVDGCIAGGFDDGTFRPTNAVSRQAAAAFLARGLSRVEVADGTEALLPGNDLGAVTPPLTLATVEIATPDLPDCQQFVQLTGQAFVAIDIEKDTACLALACHVDLELVDEDDNVVGSMRNRFNGDFAGSAMTVTAVVPASGGTNTYRLQAHTWLVDEDSSGASNIRLVATTHPFSSSADSGS